MFSDSRRTPLPAYSDFFRTEYDEQRNVGIFDAHYSILSAPKFLPSEKLFKLQRVAVVWDIDHDERVIDLLEAAYFEGLLDPLMYIAEYKGAVSIIVNNTLDRDYFDNYQTCWREISKSVLKQDEFTVDVFSIDEYVETADDDFQPKLLNYLTYIHDAWDLGLHSYNAKPVKSRRPRITRARLSSTGNHW